MNTTVPKLYFDRALEMIDEATDLLRPTGEALHIAISALVTMKTWGEPYQSEAREALRKITEKLKGIDRQP